MPLAPLGFVERQEQSEVDVQDFGEVEQHIQRNRTVIMPVLDFAERALADMRFLRQVALLDALYRAVVSDFRPDLPKYDVGIGYVP